MLKRAADSIRARCRPHERRRPAEFQFRTKQCRSGSRAQYPTLKRFPVIAQVFPECATTHRRLEAAWHQYETTMRQGVIDARPLSGDVRKQTRTEFVHFPARNRPSGRALLGVFFVIHLVVVGRCCVVGRYCVVCGHFFVGDPIRLVFGCRVNVKSGLFGGCADSLVPVGT